MQVKGLTKQRSGDSQVQRVKWSTEDEEESWEEGDRGNQSLEVLPQHWVFFFGFQAADSCVSEQGVTLGAVFVGGGESRGSKAAPRCSLGKVHPSFSLCGWI